MAADIIAGLNQLLQMPIAKILILFGVGFLLVAVIGEIPKVIKLDRTGRLAAGSVGAFLILGVLIDPDSSTTPEKCLPVKSEDLIRVDQRMDDLLNYLNKEWSNRDVPSYVFNKVNEDMGGLEKSVSVLKQNISCLGASGANGFTELLDGLDKKLAKIDDKISQREPLNDLLARANDGSPTAQNALGWRYREGINGAPKDDVEAVKWFLKAANQKLPKAENNYAWMIDNGRAGSVDRAEAKIFYERAAVQGYGKAQLNLANLLKRSNPEEAIKWYKKAAEQKIPGAAEALAELEVQKESDGIKETP